MNKDKEMRGLEIGGGHVISENTTVTVQSIDCNHVHLWYIVVYDYVLKCIYFGP